MADDIVVDGEVLTGFCAELLERVGVPQEDARITARVQVWADRRGVYSHGARAIPRYIKEIQAGRTKPCPQRRVVKEGPGFAVWDADRSLGQVASVEAMEEAISKAKKTGLAGVGVVNSGHYGAAGYYAEMALAADMLGFSTTTGPICNMAAYGGVTPVVGNVPLAGAVPAGDEQPLLLDMATGVVAMGKVDMARIRGQEIPLGWATGKDGLPTTDPRQVGNVLPLGYKGYGLALVLDALAGVLLGEVASCRKVGRTPADQSGWTHFFLAIDIASFRSVEGFKHDVDEMARFIHASEKLPGVERVFLPGEIEALRKEKTDKLGIPFWPQDLAGLEEVAQELGVTPPWKKA